MITEHIDIRAEIARVQEEVVCFRDRCLPTFFGDRVHEIFKEEYCEWVREKIMTRTGSLSEWQEATHRLADLLPLGPLAPNAPKLSRDDFREFLLQEATHSFCIRGGRIVWKISLFVDPTFCGPYCGTFPDLPTALENLPARLPEFRQWLMSLPADSIELANMLCMALPFIADADPAFAKLALDPETWHQIVLADRNITEEERTKRLKCVESQWFGHVLNNSLLHVLGALACNHFLLIEEFLDHPFLCGGYSHLFGPYVFAVLFEKVVILRQLSEERPELW